MQTIWVSMALLSVLQCHRLLHRVRKQVRYPAQPDQTRAWLIVPFKGLDVDLPGCIRSLCTQEYPDYRLILVVDSTSDPAYPVLVAEAARYPERSIQLLVAGPTDDYQSQKIHNQLHAISVVLPQAGKDDVLVFADSDAVPGAYWLSEMVVPVRFKEVIGVATGYRWLIPQVDALTGKTSIWSQLASVMNSSVACMYRNNFTSQAWGGAMAVRVETALEQNLMGWLRGSLTDDYQLSRMCRKMGKELWFAPRCLSPTPVQFDLSGFLNFVRRQYTITRVYVPGTFLASLSMLTLWVMGMTATWLTLMISGWQAPDGAGWKISAGVIVLLALLHQMRALFRRRVVIAAFGEDVYQQLKPTLLLDQWGTWFWMTLHWLLMLSTCVGNRITWRGITYKLNGPQNIRRVDD
ncbi:MAG: glycosyltransferase family 2 protein [Candidatus Competibacteraceae bacterium]|nr:glycosyltransferase family 2 protein [Candidatus Competibacteraceae bacterium]